jgi:hypothetical protein
MSHRVVHRSRVPATAVLSAALALLMTSALAFAQGSVAPSTSGPDQPVSSTPDASFAPPIDPDASSIGVEPEPGLLDIRTQGWDHLSIAPDGRTVTVYFYSGVTDCYGLAGVVVDTRGTIPAIQVQVGSRFSGLACPDIALLYHTVVTLDAPLVVGGAS